MDYAKITTQYDIVEMLTYPERYIDEYSDTEILTIPDAIADGGLLRFSIGVENGEYYIVVEDNYCSDDVFPCEGETLMHALLRAINDNLARE